MLGLEISLNIILQTFARPIEVLDGLAIVGRISAGMNDLRTVSIAGDLGIITADSGTAGTPAIKALTVNSFGRYGLPVDPQNFSGITGDVNSFVVNVTGDLLSARIGGSVIGGDGDSVGRSATREARRSLTHWLWAPYRSAEIWSTAAHLSTGWSLRTRHARFSRRDVLDHRRRQ